MTLHLGSCDHLRAASVRRRRPRRLRRQRRRSRAPRCGHADPGGLQVGPLPQPAVARAGPARLRRGDVVCRAGGPLAGRRRLRGRLRGLSQRGPGRAGRASPRTRGGGPGDPHRRLARARGASSPNWTGRTGCGWPSTSTRRCGSAGCTSASVAHRCGSPRRRSPWRGPPRPRGCRSSGLMFYDAQIAGLPDSSPAVRLVKKRSAESLAPAPGRGRRRGARGGGPGVRQRRGDRLAARHRSGPRRDRAGGRVRAVRPDPVRRLRRLHPAAGGGLRPAGRPATRPRVRHGVRWWLRRVGAAGVVAGALAVRP